LLSGHHRRLTAALAEARARLGISRDRAVGLTAVALLAALTAGSVVLGVGAAGTVPHVSDIGAWLASRAPGMVVHANGLSGRVDGRVTLTGAAGHRLRVVQEGRSALVLDVSSGVVSRIDPVRLNVSQAEDYGARDAQVVTGSGVAYVVDPGRGVVQRIDPVQLTAEGTPLKLPPPLGEAGIDENDTLWVPVPATGQVVPVHDGRQRPAVRVGEPRDQLQLTIAGGTPVVTDSTTATTTVIGPTGGRLQVNLPPAVVSSAPGGLLAPPVTDGPLVPALTPASEALVVVDTATGQITTVPITAPGDTLGGPQALGGRVYVPDETTGSLIVYNPATGAFDGRIRVTGSAGILEAFETDGLLWVNDQNGAAAGVVDADGKFHAIGKYEAQVPGGSPPRSAPPAAAPPSRGPVAAPAPRPAPPTPTPTPTPPPPQAPGAPSASSGPGWIRIMFTPSTGATPTGYLLQGAPAGATVQPPQVPAAGPFTFQVSGGSCASLYAFTVVATYPNGQVASRPSIPVRPCIPPTAPQNVRAQPANHEADLTWSAPASLGGGAVTYALAWSGAASSSQLGLTGTSDQVTGLLNGGPYQFKLTAANPAGSGGSASASATLVGPRIGYPVYRHQMFQLEVRSAPNVGSSPVAAFPAGQNPTVTVVCQLSGGWAQDPVDPNLHGSIWDQVDWNGRTAYVSDLYVSTPQSAAGNYANYSYPPLYQCT
jgi:hypothetical protein